MANNNFNPLSRPIVILDIETTGLSDAHDEIIEIGAIIYNPDSGAGMDSSGHLVGSPIERSSLVKPTVLIPDKITMITGITNADVASSPPVASVINGMMKCIPEKSVIVAHNAPFDVGFLMEACQASGDAAMEWIKSMSVIDTLKAYRQTFKGRANLLAVCERFGIEAKAAHRSISDCRDLRNAYDKWSIQVSSIMMDDRLFPVPIQLVAPHRFYSLNNLNNSASLQKRPPLTLSDDDLTAHKHMINRLTRESGQAIPIEWPVGS